MTHLNVIVLTCLQILILAGFDYLELHHFGMESGLAIAIALILMADEIGNKK